MRFSEAKNHKVVDTNTAATVARVRSLLVDPASRAVVGVRLKKCKEGDALRWRDLGGFGIDAVTVGEVSAITALDDELKPLSRKPGRLLKKRTLSTAGEELGDVEDVGFDPETGRLTTIMLKGGGEIPADRLVGVGSYAVVLRDEPGADTDSAHAESP